MPMRQGGSRVGRVGRVGLVGLAGLVGLVDLAAQAPPTQDPLALVAAINSPKDEVQLKAIADELNLFLAAPIVPRKRVGFVVEVRNNVSAEGIFSSGPLAIGAKAVPPEVLTALRTAARDDNPRVGVEALYAFGVLCVQPAGAARQDLLRASGPDLAAFIGAQDPATRYAAIRVLGRLFADRVTDPPIESTVGDAIISALNDRDQAVRVAAMEALGDVREVRAVQGLAQLVEYYGRGDQADAALDAIARIAHPAGATTLTTALTSKSSTQRVIAIEGLARLRDASALPAIQAAAGGERTDASALALVFANAMLANGPIEPLIEALSRPKVQSQARGYLVDLVPTRRAAIEQLQASPEIANVLALARLRAQ